MTYIFQDDCNADIDTDTNFCAQKNETFSNCQFLESGSALVSRLRPSDDDESERWFLSGIVLQDTDTCEDDQDQEIVFADISSYRDWIERQIPSL